MSSELRLAPEPAAGARRPVLRLRQVDSLEELRRALAAALARGAVDELPLLRSPGSARYTAWLEERGVALRDAAGSAAGEWFDPRPYFDPDGVVHGPAAGLAAELGAFLALATGRRYVPAGSPLPAGVPVTEIGPRQAFGPAVLARLDPLRAYGILTARDDAALAGLVARTVARPLLGPAPYADGWFGAAAPDTARSYRAIGVVGHGRECAVELGDAILCGSLAAGGGDAAGAPDDDGTGRPSCLHGGPCYRRDRRPEDRIPVGSLRAPLLIVEMCQSVQLAGGHFSDKTSLALAALDGLPSALVGSPWNRVTNGTPPRLLDALLAHGWSLGDAVVEVNRCATAVEMCIGPLILIGDAGAIPAPGAPPLPALRLGPGDAAPVGPERPALRIVCAPEAGEDQLRIEGDGQVAVFARGAGEFYLIAAPGGGSAAVSVRASAPFALLRDEIVPALEGLRALDTLGIPQVRTRVDALERRMRLAIPSPGTVGEREAAAVEALRDEVLALQRTLSDQLLALTAEHEEYFASFFVNLRLLRDDWITCVYCGCPSAVRHSLEHVVFPAIKARTDSCPQCKFTERGTWDQTLGCTIGGPRDFVRGQRTEVEVTVRNDGPRPLAACLAFSWVFEQYHGTQSARREDVVLAPHSSRALRFPLVVPERGILEDTHIIRAAVVARGRLLLAQRRVWVVPQEERS